MTALKPLEIRNVLGVASERYPLNRKCGHPECTEPVADPHHCFPRSEIIGDSWFVSISSKEIDDLLGIVNDIEPVEQAPPNAGWFHIVIPHVIGLCRKHHDDVEEHRAWIRLEDGMWVWWDRVEIEVTDDHLDAPEGAEIDIDGVMMTRGGGMWRGWKIVGPLNPQPGSQTGKTKRKKTTDEKRRNMPTKTFRMVEEGQRGRIEDKIAQLNDKWSGDEKRTDAFLIEIALDYTLLNAGEEDFPE